MRSPENMRTIDELIEHSKERTNFLGQDEFRLLSGEILRLRARVADLEQAMGEEHTRLELVRERIEELQLQNTALVAQGMAQRQAILELKSSHDHRIYLEKQINELARFILYEVPGGSLGNEGTVATAIQLLRAVYSARRAAIAQEAK